MYRLDHRCVDGLFTTKFKILNLTINARSNVNSIFFQDFVFYEIWMCENRSTKHKAKQWKFNLYLSSIKILNSFSVFFLMFCWSILVWLLSEQKLGVIYHIHKQIWSSFSSCISLFWRIFCFWNNSISIHKEFVRSNVTRSSQNML